MTRLIRCLKCNCAALPAEDVAAGWQQRVELVEIQCPPEHGIEVNGEHFPMDCIHCDQCGQPIPDGDVAMAVTRWRGDREPEHWETQYGTLMP